MSNSRAPAILEKLNGSGSKDHLARIEKLVAICSVASEHSDVDGTAAVAELRDLTQIDSLQISDFRELEGWTSPDDWAYERGVPPLQPVPDLTEAELAEICGHWRSGDHDVRVASRFIDFVEASFPKAFTSDLIYWPPREMSGVEIAAEVFERKRILDTKGEDGLREYIRELAQSVLDDPESKPWAENWATGALRS